MKHFYKKIQGWFGARELYISIVKEFESGSRFVEVGAWKGQSAAFMAVEILNSKKEILFDVVDTWKGSEEHWDADSPSYEPHLKEHGSLFPVFKKNLEPVWDLINPIQKPSIEAASDYEAESLDFVYIDASHDYDNVVKDINAWYPKIKPSGILAGDDYGWSGVERAVKGKFGDNFIVEAKNNWIHSKLDNFDYEDFMINKLAKKNRLFKILGL